jgi:formylglycine-generating enzyme required for sulfatase activity
MLPPVAPDVINGVISLQLQLCRDVRDNLERHTRGAMLVHESTSDVAFIPGGTFRMGSDEHYPEEAPTHQVTVEGFWIDRTPVTNRQFRKFINEIG